MSQNNATVKQTLGDTRGVRRYSHPTLNLT